MCGICGIIRFDDQPVDIDALVRMNDALSHRGPDAEGFLLVGRVGETECFHDSRPNPSFDPGVGLGHRRLSIIDIDGGQQPMSYENGYFWVVFNGEIYNYIELKQELSNLGRRFHSTSDTEVLLAAYAQWGEKCLDRINGMFSFCIYDIKSKRLFMARDRLGKKPLYYHRTDSCFLFSSELPSLLAAIDVSDDDLDFSMIGSYIQYQYIHSPKTIFKNIRKMEAGSCVTLTLDGASWNERRYWEIKQFADTDLSYDDACEKLTELLYDAVKIRLRTDVAYSAFLSGGIDSSMICKIIAEIAGDSFTAYTIGYEDAAFDESPYAAEIAESIGVKHHFEIIGTDFFDNVDDIIAQFGEPFADSSALPTYAVSKIAASNYKVALTGDGGDEIFAGYNSYDTIRNDLAGHAPERLCGVRIPDRVRAWMSKCGVFPPGDYKRSHRRAMTIWSNDAIADILRPELAADGLDEYMSAPPDWLTDCQYCDLKTYLHNDILTKVDRMSMMNSLELRSPLLDYRIVEFAFSLPPEYKYAKTSDGWEKKRILKRVASKFLSKETLARPKRGFGFPVHNFMRGRKNLFETLLTEHLPVTRRFFRESAIKTMLDSSAEIGVATRLWYIYCFIVWRERYLSKCGSAGVRECGRQKINTFPRGGTKGAGENQRATAT
ncbi:MAG: asparagine synthase (glutamine-hydrolyzing) [Kiritimatiellaeota bacterium]|nr:asparagine synthase (glutamine-hydrolyzing) [Kiritimatiellota bacterium]